MTSSNSSTPRPRMSSAKSIDELIMDLQAKIRKLEKNGSTFKSYGFTRQTTLQSIPNAVIGTFTALTFPAAGSGDPTNGDITYSTAGIVIGHPGDYLLSGYVALPSTTGAHQSILLKNGAGINGGRKSDTVSSIGTVGASGIETPLIIVTLAAGDVIGLGAQQSSGGAVNTVVAGNEFSSITVFALT